MKPKLHLGLFTILLAACASSPSVTAPVVEQTNLPVRAPTQTNAPTTIPSQAPLPKPTSTPTEIALLAFTQTSVPQPSLTPSQIPGSVLDVSSLLVLPGDLPEGYSAGEVYDLLPTYIDLQGTYALRHTYQGFMHDQAMAGGVTFFIPENVGQARFSIAYDMVGWGNKLDHEYGTFLILRDEKRGREPGVEYLFGVCHALVYIRMLGTTNPDDVTSFAAKLEGRLRAQICPTGE